MEDAVVNLERRRREISSRLNQARRAALGQFFTPAAIANFMASLFSLPPSGRLHLLDPGAGIGSLTAAFLSRVATRQVDVTCYELDTALEPALRETLSEYASAHLAIHSRNFIEEAVRLVTTGRSPAFDAAILNPPYKKIGVNSIERKLLRKIGLEASNLYAGFLGCAVALSRPEGQIVAVVPRSFTNGPYFKAFRYWLMERTAITHIHSFVSRDRAFADDNVLQENVIIALTVKGAQRAVTISHSTDQTFSDLEQFSYDFADIVYPGDDERFIHIPAGECQAPVVGGRPLKEIGLDVCTGPVVDFRLKEHLRTSHSRDTVPLLYATHFSGGEFQWPREGRKPNAIVRNPTTESWLMQNGCYVVTRRFSSKEERRRVVAYVLRPDALPGDRIGFENHLNVFHANRGGLPTDLAVGLAAYLNSRLVDDYFRTFSGHTQVNATDLRRLPYPTANELIELGKKVG